MLRKGSQQVGAFLYDCNSLKIQQKKCQHQGKRILGFPSGKKPEGILEIEHGHSDGLPDGRDPWVSSLAHVVFDAGQGDAAEDGKVSGTVVLADAAVILAESDVKDPVQGLCTALHNRYYAK